MELNEGKKIIKKSRFSYIRQVDRITRLKVYNCTNITGLENVVCSQAIVEIPNGCLILFTEDNFHAGVITFEKGNSSYSSNFRFFSYIVENEHINRDDNITTLNPRNFYNANSLTCQSMSKETIHYPGHLVQYSMCNSDIECLNEGTVMLGDLEKVGWVVLKSSFNINPYCDLENALFELNNDNSKKNNH